MYVVRGSWFCKASTCCIYRLLPEGELGKQQEHFFRCTFKVRPPHCNENALPENLWLEKLLQDRP